jgi:predicted Mrr-cat superfamily restriction endonuclease
MRYWKIVAGHTESDPADEVKSVVLGDWLRHGRVSIGWSEGTPQFKQFRDMRAGDKVIAYTDRHVWAIGTVKGEVFTPRLPSGSVLYPNMREVEWDKITKIRYNKFPKPLQNKLRATRTINELTPQEWEIFFTCLMKYAK